MVCDRCIMAVERTLHELDLTPVSLELGKVVVENELDADKKESLREALTALGFELLDNRRHQTVENIKNCIIRFVRSQGCPLPQNLSSFLVQELHQDYSSLSKLFSDIEGRTIERYYIEQRIERVKELINDDELTLTQIALKMNYSSLAYLSNQFRNVTGITPSQFKTHTGNTRKALDKI